MNVTEVLSTQDNHALLQALAVLQEGGTAAFPTDTVYGLGALAFHPQAVDKLYTIKDRQTTKAIAVLIGRRQDVPKVAASFSPQAEKLAQAFWPGPLTIIVPRHPDLPDNLGPLPTLGIRIPNHPTAIELLSLTGPMAVTSANISGEAETRTAGEVLAQLDGRIDLVIDGGATPGGMPSTVVDVSGEQAQVLRQGPISSQEIEDVLGVD